MNYPTTNNQTHASANHHCRIHTGETVYNSADKKAIKGLKWINSLGNHDVLGGWVRDTCFLWCEMSTVVGPNQVPVAY